MPVAFWKKQNCEAQESISASQGWKKGIGYQGSQRNRVSDGDVLYGDYFCGFHTLQTHRPKLQKGEFCHVWIIPQQAQLEVKNTHNKYKKRWSKCQTLLINHTRGMGHAPRIWHWLVSSVSGMGRPNAKDWAVWQRLLAALRYPRFCQGSWLCRVMTASPSVLGNGLWPYDWILAKEL